MKYGETYRVSLDQISKKKLKQFLEEVIKLYEEDELSFEEEEDDELVW